jgi:hypothetical protein
MAGPGAGPEPGGLAGHSHANQLSAGIYGTIVTAAILSAAGDSVSVTDLLVSILVTLLVYWIAEEYASLLGSHLASGTLPSGSEIRGALVASWPMVTASCLPLLVLVLAALLGAAATDAANAALVAAAAELLVYARSAGRAAGLRGRRQALVIASAAVLGLLMIALKDIVLTHLH